MKSNPPVARGRPRRTTPDIRSEADRKEDAKRRRADRALATASSFTSLPDTARVRQPAIEVLLGWSQTTVWRRVKDGTLPAPRLDGRIASWSAGEVRALLNGEVAK